MGRIPRRAKRFVQLDTYGNWGNIAAGFGACIAAFASWWSIHTTNKATEGSRNQAKPILQFGRIDIIQGNDTHSDSIKFILLNTKQSKLLQIEYSTFILYPNNSGNDGSDYQFRYMGGEHTREFEVYSSLLFPLETKTKIVLMCKTTDVYGNTGLDTFTLYYTNKGYTPTDDNLDLIFETIPVIPVFIAFGSVGQEVVGYTSMLPYLHGSVFDGIIGCLSGNHDGAIDKMLYGKGIKGAMFKRRLWRWIRFQKA